MLEAAEKPRSNSDTIYTYRHICIYTHICIFYIYIHKHRK